MRLTFSSEGEKYSVMEGRNGPYRIRRVEVPEATSLCESKSEKIRRGPSGLYVHVFLFLHQLCIVFFAHRGEVSAKRRENCQD